MKFKLFALLISMCLLFCSCNMQEGEATVIGNPNSTKYSAKTFELCSSRNIYKIKYFNNRLYFGSGNAYTNAGDVEVQAYDFETGNIVSEGMLPDQQISCFNEIDGNLVIPGCDPSSDTGIGNIYINQNNNWNILPVLPGAMHCREVIKFDNKFFAAVNIAWGCPVLVSDVIDSVFKPAQFMKNNSPLDFSVFSDCDCPYFFELGGKLFAAVQCPVENGYTTEIYSYQNGIFNFIQSGFESLDKSVLGSFYIGGKTEFDGKYYFANGKLFSTSDFSEFENPDVDSDLVVWSVKAKDEKLYVLTSKKTDDKYEIKVLCSENGMKYNDFISFDYYLPMISFEYSEYDQSWYFGTGILNEDYFNPKTAKYNGDVLKFSAE